MTVGWGCGTIENEKEKKVAKETKGCVSLRSPSVFRFSKAELFLSEKVRSRLQSYSEFRSEIALLWYTTTRAKRFILSLYYEMTCDVRMDLQNDQPRDYFLRKSYTSLGAFL